MSNPPNNFNSNTSFNRYKGTYFNSDIDVSGGNIISRSGDLYLATNSNIYTTNNRIQFDDTYSFTNFLNSVNIFGQQKLTYNSIEYDVGLQCEKTDNLIDDVATLSPIVSDTAFKCTNFYYDQASNSTVWSGLLTCPIASITSTAIANTTRFIEGTGNQTIGGIKTFTSNPVFPNNSISRAAISGGAVDIITNQTISAQKTMSALFICTSNIRLDGGLVLAGGTTVTATNAQLRLIPDISTLKTITTAISYTPETVTTVISGILQFTGTLNGWSTTNFTNAINYAKDLTSSAQTQINTINSNVTTLTNGSVSLSALNTFSGATNTFTNNIRHDGSLLLNGGALTITNSNLQKLQYISTITSDIQSQVTSNTTNITTNTNNINTANTNITTNTNNINTANTNITTNTNSISTANTNITNLQTKTTGISYTAGTTVLPSITTITNDFLKATSIEFTTNINNVSATIFERLRNITSDVQQQFTTLTNSISASTVPIATVISNLNPNLQTQSGGQYLLCNGQAVSRTTYANLFAVIGLNFGFPNFDQFYVPNYAGLFLRASGSQTINGVFYTSASNYYTFQADGIQDHTHNGPGGTYLINSYQQPENQLAQGYSKSATNLNRPATSTLGQTGNMNSGRITTDTRPGNYSVYYYIKT